MAVGRSVRDDYPSQWPISDIDSARRSAVLYIGARSVASLAVLCRILQLATSRLYTTDGRSRISTRRGDQLYCISEHGVSRRSLFCAVSCSWRPLVFTLPSNGCGTLGTGRLSLTVADLGYRLGDHLYCISEHGAAVTLAVMPGPWLHNALNRRQMSHRT
ncbi:hypothetical protein J6590_030459 [Homalodisca vitripennis]|nr:hypothetical protein J6590_030459 [Homalodisca vitripennis]